MMRIALSVIVAAGLLAACGKSEDKTQAKAIPQAQAPTGAVTPLPAPAAPGAPPVLNAAPGAIRTLPYAPLYPGATVTKSAIGESGVGSGGDVTFVTSDPPAKVVGFYKEQAKAAGVAVTMDQDLGAALMMSAGDSGDGKGAFQVLASQQNGKTEGQLTWADK